MGIQFTPRMTTTFSAMFGQWDQHPSPFYRTKQGVAQQAWLRMNLVTRHIDVVFTSSSEIPEPCFLPQLAILAVPLPRYLTGMQMDRILNAREGLMEARESERLSICRFESQDYGRENVHEVLRFALEQQVITPASGRHILENEMRVLGLLKNVQLWLEDLASLNEVVAADDLSLSQIGLSGADDGGWQRKSMAHVTQLALKSSGRRLADKESVIGLIRQLQERPGIVYLGLRERIVRLARLTRETMERLGDQGAELQVATRPGIQAAPGVDCKPATAEAEETSGGKPVTIPAFAGPAATQHREEHRYEASTGSTGDRALRGHANRQAAPKVTAPGPLAPDWLPLRDHHWCRDLSGNGGPAYGRTRHRPVGHDLSLADPRGLEELKTGALYPAQQQGLDRGGPPIPGELHHPSRPRQTAKHRRIKPCNKLLSSSSPGWCSFTPSQSGSTSGTTSSWHGWASKRHRLWYARKASRNQEVAHVPGCRVPSDDSGVDYGAVLSALRALDRWAVTRAPPTAKKKS